MMFVCTCATSRAIRGLAASRSASRRALAWSSTSRSTLWSSAYRQAAAKMPTCRIAPPNIRRCRTARWISVAGAGEHRPARRAEALRERHGRPGRTARASSATGRPLATAAFQSRAPSRYEMIPCSRAAAQIRSDLGLREDHAARPVVRVLDLDERRGRIDRVAARPSRSEELVAREDAARAPISVSCTPALAAAPPVSCQPAWLSRLTMTSSPGPRQHPERHLVGHRPARQPERRLLPEERGRALLEAIHGGILAVLVVADRGGRHRSAHRGRGQRDGVGAQVDEGGGCAGQGRASRR